MKAPISKNNLYAARYRQAHGEEVRERDRERMKSPERKAQVAAARARYREKIAAMRANTRLLKS